MKRIDFENGTVTNNILSAALPMLVAQILNLLYNIVDRIYIARIHDIGTTALGAVGLCFPIIMIITAFSNLFGSGGAPIFSINRGKGDSRTADMIMNTAFTMLCGSAAVLMLGLLMGVTMDVFMGTAGINTIATLFVAFCRPTLLNLLAGKDEVKDGGIPNVNRLGIKKFIKYASFMVLLHSTVFFIFETLSLHFFYLTLLRILLSSAVTLLLVYFCQRLFSVNRQKP